MHRSFAAVAVLLLSVLPAAAQTKHPDFSGNWVLDPKASNMGPMPAQAMTMHVTETDNVMKVTRAAQTPAGEQSNTMSFNLDGSASKNTLTMQGMSIEMTTTGAWQGETFVLTTSAQAGGQSVTQADKWSLDPDGKTLHIESDVSAGGQAQTLKLTFAKQGK